MTDMAFPLDGGRPNISPTVSWSCRLSISLISSSGPIAPSIKTTDLAVFAAHSQSTNDTFEAELPLAKMEAEAADPPTLTITRPAKMTSVADPEIIKCSDPLDMVQLPSLDPDSPHLIVVLLADISMADESDKSNVVFGQMV
jgi:hypothetical protein